MEDKVILTPEQAREMVKDGEYVHTFRNGGNMLFGADWKREDLLKAIDTSKCELAGATATSMKHGLCVWTDGPLFVETK